MIPNDLHYKFPIGGYGILLVFVVFALFWYLWVFRQGALTRFAKPNLLPQVLIPRSRYNFWAKVFAFCLVYDETRVATCDQCA